MTISKETLPTPAEGVPDIQAHGYNVEASLAQGIDWTIKDAVKYREQLCILKDAYLKNTALTPFDRLTMPATEKVQEKWCGTGKQMATYDIDGKKYGCHMFTPIVLGKNALLAEEVEWDSPESTADDYCKLVCCAVFARLALASTINIADILPFGINVGAQWFWRKQ